VRGADGLYIADASLLCTATGVNPQGTVMAVAHRNVLHALEKRFH
jgi:choline dehydrogenase-like flavoprotein